MPTAEATGRGGAGSPDGRDSRRWLRDMAALFALPAMWMDQTPAEIGAGLLSVLTGMLDVRAAFVRFDGAGADAPVIAWRPEDPQIAPEFTAAHESQAAAAAGITTTAVEVRGAILRVTRVPLTLPWESAVVLVSSDRPDFPTPAETHVLRVAVGQAVIAFHTARRLALEQRARRAAETALQRRDALVHSLTHDIEPALASLSHRMRDALHELSRTESTPPRKTADITAEEVAADRNAAIVQPPAALTRREAEVLGLLAQGLSNKEIAGVLWLSDRTVERHITSLYRKIGVARRSEATAFALRHPAPPSAEGDAAHG
ncbi:MULTISPECIES: helix-turn-helix transcriptional regulator [Microbacterium]|uniref:helix-turn-helix transcriptional regulator n=1 Tax=Microbacterium TaxID=33882 RepID=UPI001FD81840|nr:MULTISPECIES: LuxR family transcriptional regulator [Microbacterium]